MTSLPTAKVRVSQRPPLACTGKNPSNETRRIKLICTECTRRKVKCDKNIPCSRCVRLQKHCAREVVQVRKDTTSRRDEVAFLQQLHRLSRSSDSSEMEKMIQQRLESIGQLKPAEILQSNDKTAISDIRIVESQMWSRQSSLCYPHRGCGCRQRRSYAEMASINADVDDVTLQWRLVPFNVASLSTELAQELVQFHIEHLAWHHNVLHCPTFSRQCEIYWETGMVADALWLALYLSVMNVSWFHVG